MIIYIKNHLVSSFRAFVEMLCHLPVNLLEISCHQVVTLSFEAARCQLTGAAHYIFIRHSHLPAPSD